MTAQLANGGFKIKPIIIYNSNFNYEEILSKIESEKNKPSKANILKDKNINLYEKLYKNPRNIKIVLDAMYGSTNEQFGTSFRSRHVDKKYRYAGKTGTSQVRRITDKDRELDLDTSEIEYKNRDHALFVAFAPYDKPKYAISVLVEHGGSGSKAAAPLANKLIKKIIDRDKDREIKRKELKII